MTRRRRIRTWRAAAGVVVIGAWAVVAMIGLWREVGSLTRVRGELTAKEREWRALADKAELTEEGLAAIEVEMKTRAAEIDRWWGASQMGRIEHEADNAMRTEEAFFEVAGLVERMRARAALAGVNVKEEERFGFAGFAHAGPERERIGEVARQRELAEAVLLALFEAAPQEIVGCERGSSGGGGRGRGEADTFVVDRRWSLEEANQIRATAYRVRFVGGTEVLRDVLNRLAEVKLPLAVTAVEIEPVTTGQTGSAEEARLVASTSSEFSVTVEWLEPLRGGELAGWGTRDETQDAHPEEVVARRWAAPRVSEETEWSYEVFTPPDIFYDATTGRLSTSWVKPKAEALRIQDSDTRTAAAFELVRAKAEPYRVQLVGFVATEAGDLGVFEEVATSGVILAGAGKRISESEVVIETLVIERSERVWPDSMAVRTLVAKAEVRDERSGEMIWLTSSERKWLSDPVAVLKPAGTNEEREVRVGEEIAFEGITYRVTRIEESPLEIELVKESPGRGEAVRIAAVRER